MNVLGCVAALLAMALAYLCSRNQRWLARPLGRGARAVSGVLAVLAVALWIVGETTLPGIFAALTALMLGAVVLPYIVWLFRPTAPRAPR